MTSLKLFWQSLERTPGLAACRLDWLQFIGPLFDQLRVFFRPRQESVQSYRCPNPKNQGVTHTVISHGPDDVVGVCSAGCDTTSLATSDLIVYELDVQKLNAVITAVFQLSSTKTIINDLFRTYPLGTNITKADRRIPVFITYQVDRDDLICVVERLVLLMNSTFILLTPTAGLWCPPCQFLLQRTQSTLIALGDWLELTNKGQLKTSKTIDEIISGQNIPQKQRPGRKKMSDKDFHRRQRLWEDWISAKGEGTSKEEFCKKRGTTTVELDNIRRLLDQRKNRSNG